MAPEVAARGCRAGDRDCSICMLICFLADPDFHAGHDMTGMRSGGPAGTAARHLFIACYATQSHARHQLAFELGDRETERSTVHITLITGYV